MVPEAPLERTDGGLTAAGDGWFIVNARDARWVTGHFGAYTRFDSQAARFPQLGFNIAVVEPGQPVCYYHAEEEQEDFLVLAGECLVIIEGEERSLKQWDFVHCPAWTEHVFVGAGDGPCTLLAVGTRLGPGVVYPANDLALKHRAGVQRETRDSSEAYAGIPDDVDVGYQEGWLP